MSPHTRLTEAQRQLLADAEALAAGVLSTLVAAGEPGRINRALLRALGDHGLLERLFPADGEASAVDLCLIREGLARHCTEAETTFAVQGLGANPILRHGRPDLVAEWIPRLRAGEAASGFALTEPAAGSDVGSLSLRALPEGGGFRLTGTKIFISNAPDADVYSVFARTTEGAGNRGLTAFAVARDSDGLHGEALTLISDHPIGRLDFDGVLVPAANVLGAVDQGFRVAMDTLDLFRPSVGAFGVGMAQAALDAAVAHASRREAFGRRLQDFQAVSHQLADVATRLQAARLLVFEAAFAYDAGVRPVAQAAAMAKLYATETAQQAVDVAIQVLGARGLERGHLLEHLYREVRATRIYEGTSEVQREIIARQLFREANRVAPADASPPAPAQRPPQ